MYEIPNPHYSVRELWSKRSDFERSVSSSGTHIVCTHIVSDRLAAILGLPVDGRESRDVVQRLGPVVGGGINFHDVHIFILQLWMLHFMVI